MGATKSKEELDSEKLEALKKQTNMDEGAIRELHNEFLKDYPSGKLNQQQLCQMYKRLFPKGNPKNFCRHLFRTFDLDNNGHIDFVEFLLAINITSNSSAKDKIHWAFKIYDIDGNGYISQEEFKNVIKSIYKMQLNNDPKPSEDNIKEKCKAIFAQLDTDCDHQVTIEEFEQICLENEELKSLLVPEISRS